MPPQISDDESSQSGASEVATPAPKQDKKAKSKTPVAEEDEDRLMVDSDKDDDDEEEELGEDEYVVEKITNHLVDEDTGAIKYEVKWEGYEKKSDRTWEPEENLLEASEKILNEYLASVGGKDAILKAWEEKKAEAEAGTKKGKKRGRASTGTPQENGNKRGRKNGTHPKSTSPPASASQTEWKTPTGNWEEQVTNIDACEDSENKVVVYLTWKNGRKSAHPLSQVYKRCPQQMLKFYERHLVFKKNEEATAPKVEEE